MELSTGEAADWFGRAPRLSDLLAVIGSDVLHVLYSPEETDPLVGEPVLFDADDDELAPLTGGVLLLVGSRSSRGNAPDAVRQAGARGYSAAVTKSRGDDLTDLVEAAKAASITLLVTPDEVSWRQVDALLSAATSASAQSTTSYTSVQVGDLFPLANVIAARVGAAVSVEDPQGHMLAYSNLPHQEIDELRKQTILGRQPPSGSEDEHHYRAVIKAPGPIRLASKRAGNADRLAVPVRAGTQLLGLVFAIDTPRLSAEAEEALGEAARVAALHLLRNRSKVDADRWNHADTLRSLLSGTVSTTVAAAHLGLPMTTPTVVLATTLAHDETERGTVGVALARIIDLVSLYCESWHPKALCTAQRDTLYALLPVTDDNGSGRLRRFVDDLVTAVHHSAQLDIRVGIGSPAERFDDVPTSRRMADRVLQVLAHSPETRRVATVDDVRGEVVLYELADRGAATAELLLGPVQQLRDHDAVHDTRYADSFLAYLDHFGDAATAAKGLHVHENTLRYRIRRGQQLFGIDLTDPDERLITWLQLRLLRTQ